MNDIDLTYEDDRRDLHRARNKISDAWESAEQPDLKKGDYVLATKYRDGDPGDQFCVGFYDSFYMNGSSTRHLVVDGDGNQFRRNGFRRVAKVSRDRGEWIVKNLALVQKMQDRYSVWHWYRASWEELRDAGQ